jgi:putative ABC transport system ATP-binding protein
MINIQNVTKSYDVGNSEKVVALDNINLTLNEGEVIVLKGASGSGKSTLLSLIAAMSKPTLGEVVINEQRVSKLSDRFASLYRRDNIGFVFQKYNLITTLTVFDNIMTPLIPLNLETNELYKRVDRVMNMFHIEHKKDIVVKNLSGGEQQRVAIARSYVNDPKIILADEPTANLDEKLSLNFIEILKELKNKNKTIIIATHDPLFFGKSFVDREIEMKNGKVIS